MTQFVTVESLAGSPCVVQTDVLNPKIYINGKNAEKDQVQAGKDSMYEIALKKGGTVTFTPGAIEEGDLSIQPIPVGEAGRNLFGLSEKTTRLPGHSFYYKK